jgi:phospholipid/cholesterol/gamma-HCH transport system substrate-binding protein
MKLRNETKVGILAIAAIVLLVVGFNFLKGQQVFSKPYVLYARFSDIGALEKSNQVKINGLAVGTVYEFKPADKEVNSIIVEVHLDKDINIPRNSVAVIDGSILGSAYINISKGNAHTYYKSGDTLSTRIDPTLMSDLKTQIAPTIARLNETFDSLKITIGALNNVLDPNTKHNLRSIIANFNVASGELTQLMNPNTGAVARTFSGINRITDNLAGNSDEINRSIKNVETATGKIANADIQGTVDQLKATIAQMQTAITNLTSNKGTLGLLMNDRELYDRFNTIASRLHNTTLSAEILFDDIRIHPKRYVNISLFGGGNKGEPLTSPAVKDTIPK